MADPTYQWNGITASQTDADSPIDTALMEGIRQNLVHLKEWLGESFTPAKDHDHDGINSKSVLLADSVVTVAKLKFTRGSFSASVGGDFYIALSRYSHMPALYKQGGGRSRGWPTTAPLCPATPYTSFQNGPSGKGRSCALRARSGARLTRTGSPAASSLSKR